MSTNTGPFLLWSGIPPVRGPPCTFIFKLLNFRDRDLIFHEARNQGDLQYENVNLLIFPDYSVETQHL